MKPLWLLLLIACPLGLYSQADTSDMPKRRNSISFAPFNTLDIINPSLQIGFERMLTERFALQVEGGYILNHSLINSLIDRLNSIEDCPYTNSGFKARAELKYFRAIRRAYAFYLSTEIFYTKNRSGEMASFLIADTTFAYSAPRPIGADSYRDFFYNDKQRIGLNLKVGMKLFLGQHLFIEPHVGLGVAYRISRHYGRENLNDRLYDEIIDFDNKPGAMFLPNLPWNLKLGYRF